MSTEVGMGLIIRAPQFFVNSAAHFMRLYATGCPFVRSGAGAPPPWGLLSC